MNVDEIRRIAEIMQKHELTEFSIESEDCKMKVRRGPKRSAPPPSHSFFASPYSMPHANAFSESPAASSSAASEESRESVPPVDSTVSVATIDSPIVGTFYSASSPDSEPFVKVGDTVTPDTVVCIVEAMKVMNEIKAEKSGVVKKVLVENTQPVEFGQPLFELE